MSNLRSVFQKFHEIYFIFPPKFLEPIQIQIANDIYKYESAKITGEQKGDRATTNSTNQCFPRYAVTTCVEIVFQQY